MTTEELIDYYQNLLIIQYSILPNATATVRAFVSQVIANQIIGQVNEAFNIETAVGLQLDAVASYRGANRTNYSLLFDRASWSAPSYIDPQKDTYYGWSIYSEASDLTWYWLTYDDLAPAPYQLTDEELRLLAMFRAATNSSFLSVGDIDNILHDFFDGKVLLIDNQDMTITYQHNLPDPSTLFYVLRTTNSLPKPAGVSISIVEA